MHHILLYLPQLPLFGVENTVVCDIPTVCYNVCGILWCSCIITMWLPYHYGYRCVKIWCHQLGLCGLCSLFFFSFIPQNFTYFYFQVSYFSFYFTYISFSLCFLSTLFDNYTSYIDLQLYYWCLYIIFEYTATIEGLLCGYLSFIVVNLLVIIQLYRSSTINSLCILYDC